MVRRLLLACALTAWLPAEGALAARTFVAPPALVSSSDAGAAVPGVLDPAFARAVRTEHPARHILRTIAVDLDRDGDLDIVAATVEEPVVVWIRDDTGRFRRQRPAPAPQMTAGDRIATPLAAAGVPGEPPTSKWRGAADVRPRDAFIDRSVRRVHASDAPPVPTPAPAATPNRGPPADTLA